MFILYLCRRKEWTDLSPGYDAILVWIIPINLFFVMFYYFLPTSCDWLRLFKENNKIDKNKKTKQNKQKVIAERKFEMWETKLKQVIIELKNKKMPKKKNRKFF